MFTENNDTTRDNGNMAAAEYARKSPQFVFRPLDKRAPLFLIRNYPTDMLAQHGWTGNEEWLNKRLMVVRFWMVEIKLHARARAQLMMMMILAQGNTVADYTGPTDRAAPACVGRCG